MLFSSIGFLFIVALVAVLTGALIYWILKEKSKMALNFSAGIGVSVAVILGALVFSIRTNVIVIEDGNAKKALHDWNRRF